MGDAVGGTDPDTCSAARVLARTAAGRARVEIRTLSEIGQLEALAVLLGTVWKSADIEPPIRVELLRALDLAGSYIAGAFDSGGEMTGGSVAFATLTIPPRLHSHVTGVATGRLAAGVGSALKLDQRAWALERGVTEVVWTFDPLVRRNAIFNLAKLGAVVTGYLLNVYGPLSDALSGGEESDRLLVTWRLEDPAVGRRLASGERLAVVNDVSRGGASRLSPGPGDEPVSTSTPGQVFRVQVPADIETLRGERPELARDWRYALRGILEPLVGSGGRILGLDADGDYVVTEAAEGGDR